MTDMVLRTRSERELREAADRVVRLVAPLLARLPCRVPGCKGAQYLPTTLEMVAAQGALKDLAKLLDGHA